MRLGGRYVQNTHPGSDAFFLYKLDASGNVLWGRSASGTYDDVGKQIAIDSHGNAIIIGNFESPTLAFETDTLIRSVSSSVFWVKYDTEGNVFWARSTSGIGAAHGAGLSIDPWGNIISTGWFSGPELVLESSILTGNGNMDAFISKHDPSGHVIWAKVIGEYGYEEGYDVASDASGNIYAIGIYNSPTLEFGSTTINSYGVWDVYLAKSDGGASSIFQWPSESEHWTIYPNPATSKALSMTENELQDATLSIFSSTGQWVKEITSIDLGVGQILRLNLEDLCDGLYYVRLEQNGEVSSAKKLLVGD